MESKAELLHTIEERHQTAQLGTYDHDTGQRHSQVGNVGEALREAAERATTHICRNCGWEGDSTICPECAIPLDVEDSNTP